MIRLRVDLVTLLWIRLFSMIVNDIERMEWDSKFFGYPVCRIVFDHNGADFVEDLFIRLSLEKIRLTYLFVPISEARTNAFLSGKNIQIIDQKVTFQKTTAKVPKSVSGLSEYKGTEMNDQLIKLVLQAGIYSRFRIDANFTNGEYERLYSEWLKKSLSKELALKTFIAENGSNITGIATLVSKADFAEIGLIAVDERYRGRGIAPGLIHFAESAALSMGYTELKVVTQLHNRGACQLYEKCGFRIENVTNVYHYWH